LRGALATKQSLMDFKLLYNFHLLMYNHD